MNRAYLERLPNHPTGKPLVEVRRNGFVESIHDAAACAVNAEGEIKLAIGDIDLPIFVRSALKPIIAAAVAGAALSAGYALEPEELAVIAASHYGEPEQVAVVEKLLARSNSTEHDLQCGAAYQSHATYGANKRTVLHNCSGKHAGLLLLCTLLGVGRQNYLNANHLSNVTWLKLAGRVYGIDSSEAPLAIDGCGLPVIAVPLRAQAQGYARFSTLRGIVDADRAGIDAVRQAMMAHPRLVGGKGHFDTRLMGADPGKILAKIGAEGVHCCAVPAHDFGMAVKIIDGHDRARPPAVIGLLHELGALSPRAGDGLADIALPLLYNGAGLPVGDLHYSRELFYEASETIS